MKPEIKSILGLSSVGFIIFVLAVLLFQPSILYTPAFLICVLFVLLITGQILLYKMSLHQASPSNYISKPIQWSQRSGDPDKLVDCLVSSVEGFIYNIRDNKEYHGDSKVRQELYQRLNYVAEEKTGLSVGT